MRHVAVCSMFAFGILCAACSQSRSGATESGSPVASAVVADKAFASGGTISMQLDGGDYDVHAAADDRIRVTLNGNVGSAKVDVAASGQHADVKVLDTPHRNFKATIEVPKAADVTVRLAAGELVLAAIAGSKDVESSAGNVTIAVGDPNDYSKVDASLKAGDINADAFGESKSGLMPHLTWSGPGTRTIRASLGAGNLILRK